MASLTNVLASIPGLAGYYAKDELNRSQTAGDIQQIGALSNLQAQMQARQRQEGARSALEALGPNATEDQRVNALLPFISDPDKLASVMQTSAVKRSQQDMTKQLALQNLAQKVSTEARHAYEFAQTLPLKERQTAIAEIRARADGMYKAGRLQIESGNAAYNTGMDQSQILDYINSLRGLYGGQQAAPAPAQAPTPQPTPSEAPAASGGAPGAMISGQGLAKLTPDQLAAGIQDAVVGAQEYPQSGPERKQAYDAMVAEARRRGMNVNVPFPQAPQASPSPTPQPVPQPTPAPAPQAAVQMPPDIARLPKKLQDKWLSEQGKRETGTDDAMKKAAYNAGLREIASDERSLASVAQLEQALKRWQELNAQVETGRVVGMRPAIGQPLLQEMQQLQSYLAVNNFKPGQGQISNFERQLIKGAGPQTTNDKVTNDNIIQIQLGAVQNARDRAMFREAYLEKNKNLIGADKVWNEYIEKNPRFTKDSNGNIIPNQNRKNWESLLGGAVATTVDAKPAGIDALLEKYK